MLPNNTIFFSNQEYYDPYTTIVYVAKSKYFYIRDLNTISIPMPLQEIFEIMNNLQRPNV